MNWEKRLLSEVASFDRTGISPEAIKTGTLYVGLENITGEGKFLEVQEINAGELASTKFAFNDKHLLYGKLRPYLKKIACPNFSGICSTDILPILVGKDLDKNFLYHYLRLPEMISLANARCSGINLPRLSPKILAEFEIPLPPLPEQKQIAEVLDKADALREKRSLTLQKLDKLLHSVFLEMFGDPVRNPKGWEIVPFVESVSNTKLGLVRASHEFGENFEIPYVRMNSITRTGNLDLKTVLKTNASHKEIRDNRLEKGDFLFNTRNSKELVGKTAIFDAEGDYLFNNNIMRIRFNDSYDPYFIHGLFQTDKIQHELEIRKSGTTNVFAIYYKNLQTVPIIKPPSDLQKKFGQINKEIRKLRIFFEMNLQKMEYLFQSLQQKAFKGELFNDEIWSEEPQEEKVWHQTSLF